MPEFGSYRDAVRVLQAAHFPDDRAGIEIKNNDLDAVGNIDPSRLRIRRDVIPAGVAGNGNPFDCVISRLL